jgi:hypothetical protein
MSTHNPCGKSWTGNRISHCPVCCETFTSEGAGDRHRVGDWNDGTRRCRTPEEMIEAGLALNERGQWARTGPDHWQGTTSEAAGDAA